MPINFPNSPSGGDIVEINGITYTYDSTKSLWKSTDTQTLVATTARVSNTANIAFNTANAAFDTANTVASISTSAYGQANTATAYAQSAFDEANTRVATVAGVSDVVISNNQLLDGIKIVDGSGSGLDADTLDGFESNVFAFYTDLTTANVAEVSNLYFTNSRVYSNVVLIGYVSNSYVNARLETKANTADLTTANVPENNNLYFTNARSFANLLNASTSSLQEGTNLYFTDTRSFANLLNASTSSLQEGTNLYFTNARSRSSISSGTGVIYNAGTGVVSIGQSVGTSNDVTFANLTVTGNLLVQGDAIQFTSNNLIIEDPLFQVGKNPVGDAVDLGFFAHYLQSGIERHAGLFRDATDGQFKLFSNLIPEPSTIVDTANATYQSANLVVNFVVGKVTDISNHTTASLTEGSNLYYTNARVYANVESIGYSSNNYVNTRLSTKANVSDLTTANVTEGTNLYFTNTRSISALTGGSGLAIASNGRITATVTGGSGGVESVGGSTGNISNAQLATFISRATVPNLTVSTNVLLSNVLLRSPDTANTITLSTLNSGILTISGNAGQLFSITDNLIGTIFSVNDVSGIPSIEVNSDGRVILSEFTGNVLIGKSNDTQGRLQVNGDIYGNVFYGNGAGLTGVTGSGITTGKAIAMAIVFG